MTNTPYQLPGLASLARSGELAHAMSGRRHGSMSFRYVADPQEARDNRLKFFQELWDTPGGHPLFMPGNGVSLRPAFNPPYHPHREIHVAGEDDWHRGMDMDIDEIHAEALIIRSPGRFGHLTLADCAGVILFDPLTSTLALAHLSRVTAIRRPAYDNGPIVYEPLLARVVSRLEEQHGVAAANLIVGVSPAIAQDSYELPTGKFPVWNTEEWAPFIKVSSPGKIKPDLVGFSVKLLESKGVRPENIEIANLDTVTIRDDSGEYSFFSHRRAETLGEIESRNVFVVGMPAH